MQADHLADLDFGHLQFSATGFALGCFLMLLLGLNGDFLELGHLQYVPVWAWAIPLGGGSARWTFAARL